MKSVNSISGGKTSAYMAMHYPADYEIFSLVTIEDTNCSPKDKGLIKQVSDKLGKEFIATAEDDKTLKVVLDLEQLMGRNIIWLSGNSFDEIIKRGDKKYLPNKFNRFCTTDMKIKPIYDWWKKEVNEIVKMRIGFRYDEKERADSFRTSMKVITGRSKTDTQNKWGEVEWRIGDFPLIENKIFPQHIYKWVATTDLIFPDDSNCVGCFWKSAQQLRKNWDDNPEKMKWFADQEKNGKWKTGTNYNNIKKIGLQLDWNFGEGSGCKAGFCTD